jgi:choline dehydrogenase
MALVRTNVDLPEPDVQLNFIPLLTERNPRTFQLRKDWGITISASLCHPCSRGRVLLGPNGRPVIAHQLLGDDRDLETLIDGCLFIEKLYAAPAMHQITSGFLKPAEVPRALG